MKRQGNSSSTSAGNAAGMGLMEAILFLSLFVLIVGLLSPMIIQQIVNARIDSTRKEMELIQESILGDLKNGTYGFLGDMGRLPLTLEELRVPVSSTPLYGVQSNQSVGMGWNGPYVNFGKRADDYLTDSFGTPYDYGVAGQGQLRSAGPDLAMNTADDLVVPPQPLNPLGRLVVTLRGFDGQAYFTDPANCSVVVYYSESGVQKSIEDSVAPFLFENLPRGLHQVTGSCTGASNSGESSASATVAVQGFSQTNNYEMALPIARTLNGATSTGEITTQGNPLTDARTLLKQQQSLIQGRTDLSPRLKDQYEASRSRVEASIQLALQHRASGDPSGSRRNIERALSEVEALNGFVRNSAIGQGPTLQTQPLLELSSQLQDKLTQSLPGSKPIKP